jgi:hypothetical protein
VTQPASTTGLLSKLTAVKKTLINVLTLVGVIGAPTLQYANVIHLPGNDVLILSTVIGIAGSVLHYLAPNTTTDPNVAATQSVKLVTPSVAR